MIRVNNEEIRRVLAAAAGVDATDLSSVCISSNNIEFGYYYDRDKEEKSKSVPCSATVWFMGHSIDFDIKIGDFRIEYKKPI